MPEGVRYQILRADKAGCPPVEGEDMIFTDPQVAAQTARQLSREMGEKLMVKPITDPKWRMREKMRFAVGEYREIPWARDTWWHMGPTKAVWMDQFPHPSIERPGYVAYTKSVDDGTIDKQTIVRPGAYLNKHFSHIMDMYGLLERGLVHQFMLAHGPLDVKFATTEDEIISVYENGPETCMKSKRWPTKDGRNPASIYAAGDLQVAYLGDLDDASARTLVWPEKKIFSRVYGDIARLTAGLERLGYKWGAPVGARLKRLPYREVKFDPKKGIPSAAFFAPYIDKKNQRGGGHLSVLDKGTHLEICEEGVPGSHHCGLPDGYSGQYVPRQDEYPTFTCERCDKPGQRELISVFLEVDGEEQSWCPRCTTHYSFHCHHSDVRFSKNDVECVEVEGYHWAKYYADMYAAKCEMSGHLCAEDNMIEVYLGDDKKPKKVCQGWTDDEGGVFQSHFSGKNYLRGNRTVVRGLDQNRYAGNPELKYHSFQCDGCANHWNIQDRFQSLNNDKLFCPACHDRI